VSPRFGSDKASKEATTADPPQDPTRSRDLLTGLLAADELVDAVREAVEAANGGEHVALAYITFDGLSELNAKAGHLVTDKLLRDLSRRLKEEMRPGDAAGRITRDEFVLVMRNLKSRLEMLASLSKLRVHLADPIPSGRGYFFPMVNYGTATPPRDGTTLDALASHAEKAMLVMQDQTRIAVREDAVKRVQHARENLAAAQTGVAAAELAVREADNALAESKQLLAEAKAAVAATIEYAKSLGVAVEPAGTGR
jgi:diguanylate cyclase (GGDEF)-like protein